ncbi:MAG: molybdopterin-dependent oxidoreductase [Acidobacteria bacterium]|nr:molybdopterin-dependent oxidoreductase [Acidobacteriota bacterium]MCI0724524.1 molybdopterin-dependent oxidoreductase [Acidobacteriota bacterium]
MKRRDFLKTSGTLGATSLLLDNCGRPDEKLIPLLVPEEEFIPGVEGWIQSLCQQCSAGCGISVRVMPGESVRKVEGQPRRQTVWQAKKIEGNPNHPLNKGKICARGQAGLQVLYNPDRIQGPLKLNGPRGSGKHVPLSWPEAIRLLTARLRSLLDGKTPERLALLAGEVRRSSMNFLLEHFCQTFGTPHLEHFDLTYRQALRPALATATGLDRLPVYDIANTRYLLSLGAGFLETHLSPVHYGNAYGHMRQGRPGIRGKFVHAEPRLSLTAANADEWLPVQAGMQELLAQSLCHVIVREGLYDRDFVARHTEGFAVWSDSLDESAPATVADGLGLSADMITRVAREFATQKPSVAIGDGLNSTILSLNALVGAWGRHGGVQIGASLPEPSLFSAVAKSRKRAAKPEGSRPLRELSGSFPSPAPGGVAGVDVLLILDANPLFGSPDPKLARERLHQIPFIASFASFMDETAAMADLILPSHTYLERWDDDLPEPGLTVAVRTLGQPVLKPRFDTRHSGDVLLEVARALGRPFSDALPWEDFSFLVQEAFRPLHELQRGSTKAETFENFWEKVKTDGGWWDADAPQASSGVPPDFRFRFPRPAGSAGLQEDKEGYPFSLHIYPSIALFDGRGANQPWLQEMPDPMTTVMWESCVEINPQTAARMDIQEGDVLRVESMNGASLELPAYLYPGLRPDVVAIAMGQGHEGYGRYAERRGQNPLSLAEAGPGQPRLSGTRVKISLAGRGVALTKFGSNVRAHAQYPVKR